MDFDKADRPSHPPKIGGQGGSLAKTKHAYAVVYWYGWIMPLLLLLLLAADIAPYSHEAPTAFAGQGNDTIPGLT